MFNPRKIFQVPSQKKLNETMQTLESTFNSDRTNNDGDQFLQRSLRPIPYEKKISSDSIPGPKTYTSRRVCAGLSLQQDYHVLSSGTLSLVILQYLELTCLLTYRLPCQHNTTSSLKKTLPNKNELKTHQKISIISKKCRCRCKNYLN